MEKFCNYTLDLVEKKVFRIESAERRPIGVPGGYSKITDPNISNTSQTLEPRDIQDIINTSHLTNQNTNNISVSSSSNLGRTKLASLAKI